MSKNNKFTKPAGSAIRNGRSAVTSVTNSSQPNVRMRAIHPATDLQKLSLNARVMPESIQFGSPSNSGSSSSGSTTANEWSNLLKKTASGGISNLLGGGAIRLGIDSLVSSLGNLFSGDNDQASVPVSRFALPSSQQQTIYLSSPSTGVRSGTGTTMTADGYGQVTNKGQFAQVQNTQIVQAVKNALLTSSSLNDVISEL
jgi:hypothetical protein